MVVDQLIEQSFPTPEEKTKIKKKNDGNGPIKIKCC